MLPIEKSKDLIQQINRILRRLQHIKQVKAQLLDFITEVQQLSSTFSQKIHKEMITFQERVVKYSLYSTQKTSYIVNLAKIYREYSIQLEKNSKINLINLQRIKSDDIVKQEQKLKKKCDLFLKEFQQYLQSQKGYNHNFNIYNNKCNDLDQVIRRFRSYENPISFYNQNLTNQYIHQLDNNYNACSNQQTTIINQTQGLDQTRKWMSDHVKEINQNYVILLHIYLFVIESIINCIVLPKKDDQIEKSKIGLRNSEMDSLENQQNFELQKLNNLYASELNNQNKIQDNIEQQYSQLFKKSFTQSQLNSDYKFFYDRCDSIRTKKLKTTDEVVKIQALLVTELASQCQNYQGFQSTYKSIEKDIFTNNGIDSFKKRFRKYFGSNFMEIFELCLAVLERQKKSLEKIGKSMEDNKQKMGKLIQNKRESIKLFQKRSKMILDDHLKLKEKTLSNDSVDGEQLRMFKESITQSFNQIKKSFLQLQKNQSEIDKLFYSNLKNHYEIILREAVNKNLSKSLEKEKNRLNILRSLNVDSQIVIILKEDSRYEMLLNQCPKPNLYSTFQSLIKKRQYDQTKKLLQMKENRLKNMIRSRKGCCGITSEPIKNNVLSEHDCKLATIQKKKKGVLNVTSTGLIFEQKTWNPFSDGLRLMIPQSDISSFDIRPLNEKSAVEINTDFGVLVFQSKVCSEIIQSMQKNMTFKPMKQLSERGKKNDSSSFIKNNTSTEFRLSYDRSFVNSNPDGSKVNKNNNKTRTFDAIIKDFIKKWKQAEFFSDSFTKVIKNLPQKSDTRRDYSYKNGYSKFYLKQRRDYQVQGKDLIISYDWKISFPDSPMLHSFKHSQKVHIEGVTKELKVKIITAKCCEEQLYIKDKFYKQIDDMNTELTKFIVNTFEKEADILIEAENSESKSVDSCNIVIDEINLEDRDSKLETGRDSLRNSRLDRKYSSIIQFTSSNGFRTG